MKTTVLVLMVLSVSVAFAAPKKWTPTDTQVAELESTVRLENLHDGAQSASPSLAKYERFYAGSVLDRRMVILGEFLIPEITGHQPGIHIVVNKDEFPVIEGGGCTVIHVIYSPTQRKVISTLCNGAI